MLSYKYGFDFYKDTNSKENRTLLANIPFKEWKDYGGADVVAPWHIDLIQEKRAKLEGYTKFRLMANTYHKRMLQSLTYTEHCGLGTNIEALRNLYSPSTSPLLKSRDSLLVELNEMDSVKKVLRRLNKGKLGVAKGMFDNSKAGGFDLSKRTHLEALFLDELKLEPLEKKKKKTKDGKPVKPSFDKDFQKAYKDKVPEVGVLAEYNRINTLYSGQVKNIYEFMNKTTGNPDFYTDRRIRPTFRWDTTTGRTRSEKPNSQQRVSRGDKAESILEMYEPPLGKVYIKLDYETFEVKGLGFISGDKQMLKLFKDMTKIKKKFRKDPLYLALQGYEISVEELKGSKNKTKKELRVELEKLSEKYKLEPYGFSKSALKIMTDFHRNSASIFFAVSVARVSDEQRQKAKNFVFGSIYGMSIKTIAKNLGISLEEAEKIYKLFMKNMPEATQWMKDTVEHAQTKMYVESPIGRRRRLWGYLRTFDKQSHGRMDRQSMNSPIQGVCSDINLMATSLLIEYIESCNKAKYQVEDKDAWFICNLVHDAAEMEVPVEDVYFVLTNFERYFVKNVVGMLEKEFNYKIDVPLTVDFEVCINFGNKKKWDGSLSQAKEIQKWALKDAYGKMGKKVTKQVYRECIEKTYESKVV